MAHFQTAAWYAEHISDYAIQMLPSMLLAALLWLLVVPARKRQLAKRGLGSPVLREAAFFLFFVFCAGLAAVTLFPADFWPRMIAFLTDPSGWNHGFDVRSFYPSWEEILARSDYRNLRDPFQEIYRSLTAGPWVFFLLLGNIGIFLPIGLFSALLWRNPRWWKALLYGGCASAAIEMIQFFIGRSTDIDDVLLNSFGSLCGYWCFSCMRSIAPGICARFQCYEKETG